MYWRGADGGLEEAFWTSSVWHGPGEVPGTAASLTSAPSAVQGTLGDDVYWRASDAGLEQVFFDGSAWHGPGEVPHTGSAPPPPSTVPLPVPPAPSPAKPGATPRPGKVRARFTIVWRWEGTHTRVVAIRVAHVPRHGSVSVACAGRGCPWRKLKAGPGHLPRLLRSFTRGVLTAGDRLTVTVRAPGLVTERIEVRIRDGLAPTARLR